LATGYRSDKGHQGQGKGKRDGKQQPERLTAEILDRQPPCNVEAELGVLGSILLMPEVLDDVVMILRAEDFYDAANRTVYEHILAIHEENSKVDHLTLVDRMKSAGDYETIGGIEQMSRILNAVPHAAHAVYYAKIVNDKALYRSLILVSTDILRDAYDEAHQSREMLSQAEQKIFSILDKRGGSSVAEIKDVLHQAMDRMEAIQRGEHIDGATETGFTELDAMTGGMHGSELIILAARPSMGKTAFAMNIAEHAALKARVPVLFVSLEMAAIELADRLLCSVAQVNGHRLRNGTISQDDRRRLVAKAGEISECPLYVDDSPSRTVSEIAAAARRIKRQQGSLGMIVIDYLQLIEPDNNRDPRQEQVARIARRLKGLARELEVPILCLSQLNRQAEDGKDHRPKLSHLRESGAIEQDADVVMFVHREEYYHRGEAAEQYAGLAEIIISKQRNGPVGDVELRWQKEFTRFVNPAPERFDELDAYNDPNS
jgi:replicative DNA helicase